MAVQMCYTSAGVVTFSALLVLSAATLLTVLATHAADPQADEAPQVVVESAPVQPAQPEPRGDSGPDFSLPSPPKVTVHSFLPGMFK